MTLQQPRSGETVIRFRLMSNLLKPGAVLRLMATMAGGLIAVIAIGWLASLITPSPARPLIIGLGGTAVFIGAMVLIILHTRGATGPLLELGPEGVRLLDASGTRSLHEAPLGSVTVTLSRWRYVTRSSSMPAASLTIASPGQDPLTIGLLDPTGRFSDAPLGPIPTYLLMEEEWMALRDALGAR